MAKMPGIEHRKEDDMSVLRHIVTAAGGLAVTLMAAPVLALHAQVVAPGTNPRAPTPNPPPTQNPTPTPTANPPTTVQGGDPEVRNDLPFLQEAAGANLMEVRLGQLAQDKASNAAVKQFGQRMVTDHSRLQQELTSLVSRNGVPLSPALTSEQSEQVSRLQNLSGSEFDREYMNLMIQDHQKDISKFVAQGRDADSPQVRELAARTVPVLQQHLTLAQQAAQQANVNVAANQPVTTPNAPAKGLPRELRADGEFIRDVSAGNMLEIQLADLAQRRATNPAVKQLAERMHSDYQQLQSGWINMVSHNGGQLKPGMGKHHRDKLEDLRKVSGRDFDRAYMNLEIVNLKDRINYDEREGRDAKSNAVRQMVNGELPILHRHFADAKRIGGQVGANTNVILRSERREAKK
jgi:putative membrane protein